MWDGARWNERMAVSAQPRSVPVVPARTVHEGPIADRAPPLGPGPLTRMQAGCEEFKP
jgi:hypothetical protein